jgi:hypothetical protein
MHLSGADDGRPAAGRAIAIACQQQFRGAVPCCRFARRAVARSAVDKSRSDALTGIIGACRACTVSMISPLWMPCRYTDVIPRLLCPSWR